MRFPRSTKVVSILFEKKEWTLSRAKKWLKDHGKKVPTVETTEKYYRFQQARPNDFVKSTFRTIKFGRVSGIKALVAMLRLNKKTNPKPKIRFPRRVVHLGRCVEIHFVDGTIWRPKSRSVDLCCSESGKTLWVLQVSREKKVEVPSKLYERFHGYIVSGVKTAKVNDSAKLKPSGQVTAVVYESNKWDSKKREYIHTFRTKPRAYSDNINRPSFIKISGGRIRVKSEGITG